MMRASLVALVFLTTVAHADDEHLKRGKAHFELQEYAEAEKELKEAYRNDPKPEILYAIAQAQRFGGACDRAIVSYKSFLRGNPTDEQRKLAEDNITTCEEALAKAKANDKLVPPPPATTTRTVGTPWYRNWLGHSFVIGGAAAITGGTLLALRGQSKIDDINNAQFYDDFVKKSSDASSAKTMRTIGLAAGGAGLAAIAVGIIIYKVQGTHTETVPVVSFDPRGTISVAWGM